MAENKEISTGKDLQGTATHSGWSHFYVLFSKYRDECIKLSQVVFGTNQQTSIQYLETYHSSLYSMAQQIFSFYDPDLEKTLTDEWFGIKDSIDEALYYYHDPDFRRQMISEGKSFITKDLKTKLLMYFNKIDRYAAEAGLLVGKEKKDLDEPKKGLLGF